MTAAAAPSIAPTVAGAATAAVAATNVAWRWEGNQERRIKPGSAGAHARHNNYKVVARHAAHNHSQALPPRPPSRSSITRT